jgi:Thymidylate synthase complementing protein
MIQDSFNVVKMIQDSVNKSGNRLSTFEIETYRYIWAEILTHKIINKNAQSSRAVPTATVLGINQANPITPIVWGKNKSGMSATEELKGDDLALAKEIWLELAAAAFKGSAELNAIGLHKMWANRPTEAYSRIKVVITGTEWDNFLWLRDDPEAAQPEIVDLARKIKAAMSQSTPLLLSSGQMHVPYVNRVVMGKTMYYYSNDSERDYLSEDDALKISASCCGQVSYRKLDDTYEKAMAIYTRLFDGAKPHLSPTEHQGIAMISAKASLLERIFPSRLALGVSAIDRQGYLWSANLRGFIQYRKIMENNAKLY